MFKENIAVFGAMKAVNAKIGKLLAEALGMSYLETDHFIEYDQNTTIPTLVTDYGKAYFYTLEEDKLKELADYSNTVIVTSGTTAFSQTNVLTLKDNSYVVLLLADGETTLRRLERDESCYLQRDLIARSRELMRSVNTSIAAESDIIIDTTQIRPKDAVNMIIDRLQELINNG